MMLLSKYEGWKDGQGNAWTPRAFLSEQVTFSEGTPQSVLRTPYFRLHYINLEPLPA